MVRLFLPDVSEPVTLTFSRQSPQFICTGAVFTPARPRSGIPASAVELADRRKVSNCRFARIALALKQPWTSVDNDSPGTAPDGLLGQEHPHPRAYGTFPRILRKYVREDHLITFEDAIRKFTSLPAQRMRLADRGVLKQGMWADVVIFDPEQIRDLATFEQPNQLSVGMKYVFVNGVAVIAEGKITNMLPGKLLYGPGYRAPAKRSPR